MSDTDRLRTRPGVFLREMMEEEGITQQQLADALGVSRLSVNHLYKGGRSITVEMALRLEIVTRVSAEMWLNLQRNVELAETRSRLRRELAEMRPLTRKREFVDVAETEVQELP